MSFKLVDLVRKRKYSSAVRRMLLTILAQHADDDGRSLYPSIQTLAAEAGCHPDTVRRNIKGLIADGLLELVGPRACRHGYVNEYRLNVAALCALPDAKSPHRATPRSAPPLAPRAPSQPLTPRALPPDPSQSASQLCHGLLASSSSDWRAHPWMKAIFEIAGPGLADPDKDARVALDLSGRISSWQAAGWSLEEDVLPTIAARTAKPRKTPMFTFMFLEEHVAEHHALRMTPAPVAQMRSQRGGSFTNRDALSRLIAPPPKVRKSEQDDGSRLSEAETLTQRLATLNYDLVRCREGRPFSEYRGKPPPEGWEKWIENRIADLQRQMEAA